MKTILGFILTMPLLTSCAPGALWSNVSAVSGWSYHAHEASSLSRECEMHLMQQVRIEMQKDKK